MHIAFSACAFQLFLIFYYIFLSSACNNGYEEVVVDPSIDDLGYFSLRDCFYIVNMEGSSLLQSGHVSMDHKLGAILAVDKTTNKRIFNASSQIWYLSPKTGQLLNMWEEMLRMEPFSLGPHPRYICLRPRTNEKSSHSGWIIQQDQLKDGHLIVKHEASGHLLTFNGKNRSVSLEPSRTLFGKGGLSAVIYEKEPFRLKHASSFYQKPISPHDSSNKCPLRSTISDQRWIFEPFVDNLFLIATSVQNSNDENSFLAITDCQELIKSSTAQVPKRVKASILDIDDPRQMWFREKSTNLGDVIRNLATGNILDAAFKVTENVTTNPLFDLPPMISNDEEDKEEEDDYEDNLSKRVSVYLVSSPYLEEIKRNPTLPLWMFDFSSKRWLISLPNALKLLPQKSRFIFSGGKMIQRKSREEKASEALSILAPGCKEAYSSLTFHKDKSRFAISLEDENSIMLEQVIQSLVDKNNDISKTPPRQIWIEVPLAKADDPATLSALFSR